MLRKRSEKKAKKAFKTPERNAVTTVWSRMSVGFSLPFTKLVDAYSAVGNELRHSWPTDKLEIIVARQQQDRGTAKIEKPEFEDLVITGPIRGLVIKQGWWTKLGKKKGDKKGKKALSDAASSSVAHSDDSGEDEVGETSPQPTPSSRTSSNSAALSPQNGGLVRAAVRAEPPVIMLVYKDAGKTRCRKISLKSALDRGMSSERLIAQLHTTHGTIASVEVLRKCVEMLDQAKRGGKLTSG
jgi:hypothetical protein